MTRGAGMGVPSDLASNGQRARTLTTSATENVEAYIELGITESAGQAMGPTWRDPSGAICRATASAVRRGVLWLAPDLGGTTVGRPRFRQHGVTKPGHRGYLYPRRESSRSQHRAQPVLSPGDTASSIG